MNNETVLDLKDYPDIDLNEFIEWFKDKYFKEVIINNDINWYKGKYDVEMWFHRDWENKKFSIELKLVDISKLPSDPHTEELIKQLLEHDKPEDYSLDKNDGLIK